jgi:hypothetical protein
MRNAGSYRDVLGLAELAAGPGWVQFDFGETGVLELVQRSGEPEYDQAPYQVGYAVADIESAWLTGRQERGAGLPIACLAAGTTSSANRRDCRSRSPAGITWAD